MARTPKKLNIGDLTELPPITESSAAIAELPPRRASSRPSTAELKLKGLKMDGFFILKHSGCSDPKEVKSFVCNSRTLNAVDENDAATFEDLLYIDVGDNRLRLEYFVHFKELIALRLHCNGISRIQLDPSKLLDKLEILDLSYNSLTDRCFKSLSQLSNLRELDLSYNEITLTNEDIRDFLKVFLNLEILVLSKNNIKDFSFLSTMPALKELSLAGNEINTLVAFDEYIQEKDEIFFPKLEYVNLSETLVESAEELGAFMGYPSIDVVDVRSTGLDHRYNAIELELKPKLQFILSGGNEPNTSYEMHRVEEEEDPFYRDRKEKREKKRLETRKRVSRASTAYSELTTDAETESTEYSPNFDSTVKENLVDVPDSKTDASMDVRLLNMPTIRCPTHSELKEVFNAGMTSIKVAYSLLSSEISDPVVFSTELPKLPSLISPESKVRKWFVSTIGLRTNIDLDVVSHQRNTNNMRQRYKARPMRLEEDLQYRIDEALARRDFLSADVLDPNGLSVITDKYMGKLKKKQTNEKIRKQISKRSMEVRAVSDAVNTMLVDMSSKLETATSSLGTLINNQKDTVAEYGLPKTVGQLKSFKKVNGMLKDAQHEYMMLRDMILSVGETDSKQELKVTIADTVDLPELDKVDSPSVTPRLREGKKGYVHGYEVGSSDVFMRSPSQSKLAQIENAVFVK
ncbi:hypothetical protein PCE1_002586 [Barthelona sp. PCE]